MAHTTLNRVIVRMLYDPQFTESIYANPQSILDPLGIPHYLQQELVKNDPRAWAIDTERRRRSLHALMGEFQCSSTIALAHLGQLAALDNFFSEFEFHNCIQNRNSMAVAFGEYLTRLHTDGKIQDSQYRDITQLELQKAICRRQLLAPKMSPKNNSLFLQPGVACRKLNSNVIEALNLVEQYLYEISLLLAPNLCTDIKSFPNLPRAVDIPDQYLFYPQDGEILITPLSVVIYDALTEVQNTQKEQDFISRMNHRGLSLNKCHELLVTLEKENLIFRGTSP